MSRTPLAWLNTVQHKKRSAVAVGGVAFSILLIFMQVGFLDAARKNASIVFPLLDFDLIVISSAYLTLPRSDSVNIYRAIQAGAVEGVERSAPFWIEAGGWENPDNGDRESCMVLAASPDTPPFFPELNRKLPLLREPATMLVDTGSRGGYGSWAVGDTIRVNNQSIQIADTFYLGPGLLSDGSIITSLDTFTRLFGPEMATRPNFALIQLKPGSSPESVKDAIRDALPGDVNILTRREIIDREQRYFINVKPIGIMFKVGAAVAFVVGATILYQILSTEITRRLREFATLKAIGYPTRYIYGIGLQQGLYFSLLGFVPAFILAFFLYRLLHQAAGLPLFMEWGRATLVLLLSLVMCACAAAFSLGKIKRADPADLF